MSSPNVLHVRRLDIAPCPLRTETAETVPTLSLDPAKHMKTPKPKNVTRRYSVELIREVRMHAHAEVEATSEEEAQDKALAVVDAPRSDEWREDTVVDQQILVKEAR